MAYTTINKSSDYFNTKLYTGNNSAGHAITGVGFQPDWTWIKSTDGTYNNQTFDSIRGTTKSLVTNEYAAEITISGLTAFGADGFTLGSNAQCNSGGPFVSWNWKANGAGSANTDGSTNSTVSVNDTAGFSIVSYVGNSTNSTVGHGLSTAPKMIIFKNRNDTASWRVAHDSIGWNKSLFLDNTNATQTEPTYFNSTAPTNQVFYLGTNGGANNSGDNIIAYCFAEKTGYSKFGSYTGIDSSDNAFIYTGFKPKYILTKEHNASANGWLIYDTTRNPNNPMDGTELFANTDGAESDSNAYVDFLSNGFKIRSASGKNGDGEYIYMAFGQTLVGTNNVPCTAR